MKHSLKANYLYNLLYQILVILLPFVTTPYISRILTPSGIGAINYTSSIVTVIVLVASLGSGAYAQKEIAFAESDINKRSKVFWSVLWIRISASVLVSIVYFFLCQYTHNYKDLFIVQYLTIIANMFDIVWLFQGMEDFKKTSIRSIIIKIISVVSVFIFVQKSSDLTIYALILALSSLANALILWAYIPKIVKWQRVSWVEIKKHILPILLLFLPMAAIYIYTYVDKIILGLLSTEAQVGFYSQAERIVKLPMTIITSLGTVLMPRVASLVKSRKWDTVRNQMLISIRFVFFLGLPMMAGMSVIASLFVPWFFGSGYEQCIFLIQCLSVLIIIISLSSVTGQAALIPLNKQVVYTFSIIVGAVINVIFNIALIPKYEAIGAVIGTILAELVVGIIQWTVVLRCMKISIIEVLKDIMKPFFSVILITIILIGIKPFFSASALSTLIFAFCGVFLYFIIMIIFQDKFMKKILAQIIYKVKKKV